MLTMNMVTMLEEQRCLQMLEVMLMRFHYANLHHAVWCFIQEPVGSDDPKAPYKRHGRRNTRTTDVTALPSNNDACASAVSWSNTGVKHVKRTSKWMCLWRPPIQDTPACWHFTQIHTVYVWLVDQSLQVTRFVPLGQAPLSCWLEASRCCNPDRYAGHSGSSS